MFDVFIVNLLFWPTLFVVTAIGWLLKGIRWIIEAPIRAIIKRTRYSKGS